MKYFQITAGQVADELGTDLLLGLHTQQVRNKRETFGENYTLSQKRTSLSVRFLALMKEPVMIALTVSVIVSVIIFFVQQNYMSIFSSVVLMLLAALKCFADSLKEGSVEKTLNSLKYSSRSVHVLRDGHKTKVPPCELVPGDVIFLQEGDLVPADARIVKANVLKVNESRLTSENTPVDKHDAVITGDNHEIRDLVNMLFAGTVVLSGSAKAIVTWIGKETRIHKTFGLQSLEEQEQSPLLVQAKQLSKVLLPVVVFAAVLLFVLCLVVGHDFAQTLLFSATFCATALPIGLGGVVSLCLAFALRKLFDRKARIQSAKTAEHLAATNTVCVDKTGILTQNSMAVSACYAHGKEIAFERENYRELAELLFYGSMCNDAAVKTTNNGRTLAGDATEGAILLALEELGMKKNMLDAQYPRMGQIPFDPVRKCKSSIHVIDGRNLAIVKGTPESILDKCINDSEEIQKAKEADDALATAGLRVLAVAVKEIALIPPELFAKDIETGLTLIGLIGLRDAERDETADALRICDSAGIKPIIFTGDQSVTAKSVAEHMGILHEGEIALSGQDIEKMSAQEFERAIPSCRVFSRISGAQKARIVTLLKENGAVVTVTGESVDDLAAMTCADVGCALTHATDANKLAADLVLEEDNFSALVSAIQQGRGFLEKTRNSVQYLLAVNVGLVLSVLILLFFTSSVPILPLQQIWLCAVVYALPLVGIGVEKTNKQVMKRRPYNKKSGLLSKSILLGGLLQGALVACATVLGFFVGVGFDVKNATDGALSSGQTLSFAVLAISLVLLAMSNRSKESLLKIGFFSNVPMLVAMCLAVASVLFVLLVPGVNTLFGLAPITGTLWLWLIILSALPLLLAELVKMFKK